MSFEYDNAREIISALDSEIDTIVEQLCPLMGNAEKWDFSKKKSKEIHDAIRPMIEEIKDVADEEIKNLLVRSIDLEEKVNKLEDQVVTITLENAELLAQLADLTMKLEQPGKWYGKKFGL